MCSHSASVQRRPRSVCAIVQAPEVLHDHEYRTSEEFHELLVRPPRSCVCHNEKWFL